MSRSTSKPPPDVEPLRALEHRETAGGDTVTTFDGPRMQRLQVTIRAGNVEPDVLAQVSQHLRAIATPLPKARA